jgi:CheY-like chemotaxis protein
MAASPLHDTSSILIVDDDPFGQELLCTMLSVQGFTRVEVASNGRDALRQLADDAPHPPDYLISDLFMPDMDGFELINGLAAARYKGGVILLSGVDSEMLSLASVMAREQGLNVLGAFFKPLHAEVLVKLLRP